MIEIQRTPEKVVIVGVQTSDITDQKFEMLLDEMQALTETAGGIPMFTITQKLPQIQQKTAVGSGKLADIRAAIEADDIQLVIFLNKLSPSSNKYLGDYLGIRVIDRVQLILDIFAQRAQSKAGKLQVQLAQYEYMLPRIIGKGQQLSRLGGGIGTRGPGETQLETDRRVIRRQISQIKKDLAKLVSHRERTRDYRRSGREFNIGLIGYTNAGKSTLLSQLTGKSTYIEDQLFATLDPLTRKFSINGHEAFTLTDTVGFIDELPTELIYAFKSTLEEIRDVDLLVHVVDASHPSRSMHEDTVSKLLKELKMDTIPILTVYNKLDKVKVPFLPNQHPSVSISALQEADLDQVKQAIWDLCIVNAEEYTVEINAEDADLIATYRQKSLIDNVTFDEVHDRYILHGYRR